MSRKLEVQVEAVLERRLATMSADIINVATNSSKPVLEWSDVEPGSYVNSIGGLPNRVELSDDLISRSVLFVDYRPES